MEPGMELEHSELAEKGEHGTSDTGTSVHFLSGRSRLLLILLALVALVFFIVGIALIASAVKKCQSGTSGTESSRTSAESESCRYSEEARQVGLEMFLKKVQDSYYTLHPEKIALCPMVTADAIRSGYKAFDCTPWAIKERTDAAYQLLDEVNKKQIRVDILKPREYKALLQVKHYLKYIFATTNPYENNYYSGDWMLGPNLFCWQPICNLGLDIKNNIGNLKPTKASEVGDVIQHFKDINASVTQYIENLKLGIKTGMVRTVKECHAGIFAVRKKFDDIAEHGGRGVLAESFAKPFKNMTTFLEKLSGKEKDAWRKQTGKSTDESLRNALIEHVGKPLSKLLNYLENEHILHCRPDTLGGGGLSGLPVDFVYYNGTANKSMKTTKKLPIPDERGKFPTILNGSKSYEFILGYFTTKELHPDEVHQLGLKMLDRLYPQAEEVARKVTKISNTTEAVTAFQAILRNRTLSYFNEKEIPENQTTGAALRLCKSIETAKKYCPDRWAAMEKWFEMARKVMAMLDPKTVSMFYFFGDKHTTPNCPVRLRPDFNPAHSAQSYDSDKNCTAGSIYNIQFFLKDVGPKFSEYSINAHEARPGHHTQIQGNIENFSDKCGGLIKWLNEQTSYKAFLEGWALYAENPLIAQQTDVYKNNPMQKFGMLKWQIWRALRLIVDTGLHYRGMKRQHAKDLFAKYAWDNTDFADKEITRYQSIPGQATAYMIGQLDIWSFRNKTQEKLGDKFSLKDFHYQALSQGSSPLTYLQSHIDKYITCTLNPKKEGCNLILNPIRSSGSGAANKQQVSELDIVAPQELHFL